MNGCRHPQCDLCREAAPYRLNVPCGDGATRFRLVCSGHLEPVLLASMEAAVVRHATERVSVERVYPVADGRAHECDEGCRR